MNQESSKIMFFGYIFIKEFVKLAKERVILSYMKNGY